MNARWVTARYIIFDVLSAMAAWALLFMFRKVGFEHLAPGQLGTVFADANLWRGIVIVPLGWIALYTLQGSYKNVLRKSRLKELQQTATATLIGTVVLFFVLLLDDEVGNRSNYYLSLLFLLVVHFVLTYCCRLVQTSATVRRVHNRQLGSPPSSSAATARPTRPTSTSKTRSATPATSSPALSKWRAPPQPNRAKAA